MAKPIFVSKNKLFTPRLRAFYITLGDAKVYNDEDKVGSFSVSLTADPGEVDEWKLQMESIAEDLYTEWLEEAGKKKVQRRDPLIPMKMEEDREGNETGNLLFKFNRKAKRKQGDSLIDQPVKVVDTQNHELTTDQKRSLGRGSLMAISFDAKAYYMSGVFGVSFGLRAVQVIEPVWRESDASTDFNDRATEGFTIDEEAVEASDFA